MAEFFALQAFSVGLSRKGYDRFKLIQSLIKAGAPPRVLDDGIAYEFLEWIGAGDMLSSISRIVEITEKESKSGKMLISTTETTWINQDRIVVAISRARTVFR